MRHVGRITEREVRGLAKNCAHRAPFSVAWCARASSPLNLLYWFEKCQCTCLYLCKTPRVERLKNALVSVALGMGNRGMKPVKSAALLDQASTIDAPLLQAAQHNQYNTMDEEQPETEYANLEVSQGAAAEDTAADTEDTAAEANKRLLLKQYLCSPDFREIIWCFIFGVLCMLTQYPGIPLTYRDIPKQVLENTGDIVENLTNAETYTGDTVSSKCNMRVSCILVYCAC